MSTRRSFIAAGTVAAVAGIAGLGDPSSQAVAAPKGPSPLALAQARWLRQTMPLAKLNDELVEKIAGDIDGYASVAADFRKATLRNWDEPDFVFTAGPQAPQR